MFGPNIRHRHSFALGTGYYNVDGSLDLKLAAGTYANRTTQSFATSEYASFSSIYGNSPTVQPPSLALLPCIKI